MRLLLDTHAFLWFIAGDARLSPPSRAAIENLDNECWVSAACLWEIAIKTSLGKLQLSEPFGVLIPRELQTSGFRVLPLEINHFNVLVDLPFHHRDPFDRLIVAQAMATEMTLVSADVQFDAYGVRRVW